MIFYEKFVAFSIPSFFADTFLVLIILMKIRYAKGKKRIFGIIDYIKNEKATLGTT